MAEHHRRLTVAEIERLTEEEAIEAYRSGALSPFEYLGWDLTHNRRYAMPRYNAVDIRNLRKKLGISQEFLAKILGVSQSTMSRVEQGAVALEHYQARIKDLDESVKRLKKPDYGVANRLMSVVLRLFDAVGTDAFWLFKKGAQERELRLFPTKSETSIMYPSLQAIQHTDPQLLAAADPVPECFNGRQLKHLRIHRLVMTTEVLAAALNVTSEQIEKWEAQQEAFSGPLLVLLESLWRYGADIIERRCPRATSLLKPLAEEESEKQPRTPAADDTQTP